MNFQFEDADPQMRTNVLNVYSGLASINVLNTPPGEPMWDLGLVRYEKNLAVPNFPAHAAYGAQWTNVVTSSHMVALDACRFLPSNGFQNLLILRLSFPVGVSIPWDPADIRKPPYIKQGMAKLGIEYWLDFAVQANQLGVIPLQNSGGRFI